MVLFADNEFAAGANLVGCLLAAITGFFSWLSARDRLRFDAGAVKLRGEVDILKLQHDDCEEKYKSMQVEVGQLRRQSDRRTADDPRYHGPERREDS